MRNLLAVLRTLLVLGRASNLPTVWSNLIAGWVLVEAFDGTGLSLLLAGVSFLYIGGMYLNDFCDAQFDTSFRSERPIPSNKISKPLVGFIAVLLFAAGMSCFIAFGWKTRAIALLLLAAIVLYDFHHKNIAWAPLLMGFCRFLLYPLAATAAAPFYFPAYVWWAGAALGLYVAGITYLAQGESRPGRPTRWALLLLAIPVILSIIFCLASGYPILQPLFYCALIVVWTLALLIPFWRKTKPSIGRVVSGLLAGIVLVDMVAISPGMAFPTAALAPLFVAALLLQRIIPAT
jgi:4-hydroxybenzoate polyprenyltransferase